MTTTLYQSYLKVALEIIEDLREVFINAKKTKKISNLKSSANDLVTETDKTLENIIKNKIKSAFPDHLFIGEESSYENKVTFTDQTTWIVDPLDGTTNFVHGFPFHCVSIAVAHQKESVVGVVFVPEENNVYSAVKGGGAFLNGNHIKVSDVKDKKSCLVLSEWGSGSDEDILLKSSIMQKLMLGSSRIHGIRSSGSAAINCCLVARGSADCYYEWGHHCWDVAAGSIIVSEAGGVAGTIEGTPLDLMARKYIFASSKELLNQIDSMIGEIIVKREDE